MHDTKNQILFLVLNPTMVWLPTCPLFSGVDNGGGFIEWGGESQRMHGGQFQLFRLGLDGDVHCLQTMNIGWFAQTWF